MRMYRGLEILPAPSSSKAKRNTRSNKNAWSAQEEMLFEEALAVYWIGNTANWKQIAEHVRTKTVAQVKAHAQAYFDATGGQLPNFSPEKLAELRSRLPAPRPPSRPGRKPKANTSSTYSQTIMGHSSLSSSSKVESRVPSSRRGRARAGEVIVLRKAAEEDEDEDIDIDYDSDHISIADDDEDERSTSSASTHTPLISDESSMSSSTASLPSPTNTPPPPVIYNPPPVVQFASNSLMMLPDSQLEWLLDLELPPRQVTILPPDTVTPLEMRANGYVLI